jgi:threonine aldolase
MIYFNNDYSEGGHPKVLDALVRTNMLQTLGYGEDEFCAQAAEKIKKLCGRRMWQFISWLAAPKPI